MSKYDDKGRGVLFVNRDKKEDKHPDYTGKITLQDGTKKQLSAWRKTSKNGMDFISVQISDKWEKKEKKTDYAKQAAVGIMTDFSEDIDIPF